MFIWKLFWEFPLTAAVYFVFAGILLFCHGNASLFNDSTILLFYPGKLILSIGFVIYVPHQSDIYFLTWFFLYFLGRAVGSKGRKRQMVVILPDGWSNIHDGRFHDSRFYARGKRIPSVGAWAISGLAAIVALLSPVTYRIAGRNFPFPVFLIAG